MIFNLNFNFQVQVDSALEAPTRSPWPRPTRRRLGPEVGIWKFTGTVPVAGKLASELLQVQTRKLQVELQVLLPRRSKVVTVVAQRA
jgi:hypothetical protein